MKAQHQASLSVYHRSSLGRLGGWPMQNTLRILIVSLFAVTIPLARGQQTTSVTISEPARLSVEEMFKRSDKVALVRILSGDAENYDVAVYRGEVVENFKGTSIGQKIYFGPYVGMRIGREYVLFLLSNDKELAPKSSDASSFGTIPYSRVFNEGYSAMETSYECVFSGNSSTENCDYAVQIFTDYIVLPKSLRGVSPVKEDAPFGGRWVKKKQFLALLEKFR